MNRSKAWIILFLAGIGILGSGCSRTTPEPAAQVRTLDVSETAAPPTATPSSEPSATPTPSPTATVTPSATASPEPTATATPSPTSEPLVGVINSDDTNILTGPATNYAFLASLNSGFRLEIIGKNEAGDWLVVRISPEQYGWVALDRLDIVSLPDDLAVYEAPPVPPPTATSIPIPVMSVAYYDYANPRYVCLTIDELAPNQSVQIAAHYVRLNGNIEDFQYNLTADEKGRAGRCLFDLDVTNGTITFSLYSGAVLLSVLVYTVP